MLRTKPPLRADHVGSLLHPAASRMLARSTHGARSPRTSCTRSRTGRLRDRRQAAGAGLASITDGEFRRSMWHRDFLQYLTGVQEIATDVPDDGAVKGAALNLRIAGKLDFPADHPHLDHFRFIKTRARRTAKMTIPSPSVIAPAKLFDMQDAKAPAYRDLDKLYDDLTRRLSQGGEGLLRRRLPLSADRRGPAWSPLPIWNSAGRAACRMTTSERLVRAVRPPWSATSLRDRPADMTDHHAQLPRQLPLALGRPRAATSRWPRRLFNITGIDGYFLEYDSERAGGFEPLRFLPKRDKLAVLGLVTSKTGALETKDDDQAAHRRSDESTSISISSALLAAVRLRLDRRRQRACRRAAMGQARLRQGDRRRRVGTRLRYRTIQCAETGISAPRRRKAVRPAGSPHCGDAHRPTGRTEIMTYRHMRAHGRRCGNRRIGWSGRCRRTHLLQSGRPLANIRTASRCPR